MRRLIVSLVCLAGVMSVLFANDRKELTVDDIFNSDKFKEKRISDVQWSADGQYLTYTRTNAETGQHDSYQHNIVSGEERTLAAGHELVFQDEPVQPFRYEWSQDGKHLLVVGKREKIWRHSWQAPHYLYTPATGQIIALAGAGIKLSNVKLSPDGNKVGYVRDSNIFVYDIGTGEDKSLTSDGSSDILNGVFDWVYEEEFGLGDAWRWSPDGSKIAFWWFDQTRVKTFHLVDEIPLYNAVYNLKYPKAGEQNALMKVGIIDVASGRKIWVDLGPENDIYVPRIFWTNTSKQLALIRLNRHQNHIELLLADSETGRSRKIIDERNDTWIDVEQDILFANKNDRIVWLSERSGYKHAYLYDYNGKLLKQLTSGKWEIDELAGLDEKNNWLVFYGRKDSQIEHNVYRVKLSGGKVHRISNRAGWHTGDFSPDCQYVLGRFSDAETPPQIMLRKGDGKFLRFLEKNEMPGLQEFSLPEVEFLDMPTPDGVELHAYMIKPPDFDEQERYPVLVYGYGGPGSQQVRKAWLGERMLWHKMLATKGYIIFCVDNRGTGARGKAFKDLAYLDLSKWSTSDQIEGLKYLRSLPYVDSERIGFWGKSGGGYLTLLMMTRAAEYLKMGISVAPVSDFRFYDTIWTERYMGLPSANEAGYNAARVLGSMDQLRGKLLLIHGTGDDNVHFQNSIHVIQELQDKGLLFDLMIYPNQDHALDGRNTSFHWYATMADYIQKNL